MCTRGKGHYLDFSDDEIKKLKECFNSLDDDKSGSIGIEELEGPLIGLGFADTREEIELMIKEVDADGSGMIEFDEFLMIIKNSDADEKTSKIN
jgi:Ca2+-binding EF-hand superfamily protein